MSSADTKPDQSWQVGYKKPVAVHNVHNAIPILCIVDFAETVNGCPQVEASRDTIASSSTCLDHRRKPPNINLIRMIRTELDIGEKAMTKIKMEYYLSSLCCLAILTAPTC